MRIGYGYDVHRLVEGRALVLGGVTFDHPLGLEGHSDADVLLHAVADALLGALALGDLGRHFPPGDSRWKDVSSLVILDEVVRMVHGAGWRLGNLDVTVAAQAPKLAPHVPTMREKVARALEAEIDRISIKATTTEGLGFAGREEGISATAVVLLERG